MSYGNHVDTASRVLCFSPTNAEQRTFGMQAAGFKLRKKTEVVAAADAYLASRAQP